MRSNPPTGDWAEKLPEDRLKRRIEPLHRRRGVRVFVFCFLGAAALGLAVALAFFNRWHDERRLELARQRASFDTFLRSAEFGAFARAMDAQLVAMNNFIVARPAEVRALLPAVAAFETAQRVPAWPVEVMPLPISAAREPPRVARAIRAINSLLAARGHRPDAATRDTARRLCVQTLAPYMQAYLRREPAADFHALFIDRPMQEAALAAFAAHLAAGVSVAEAERFFVLYAIVGPALWRALEAEKTAGPSGLFARSAALP
jgi:hypothetical protein